ncbi:peptidylprolyl isomerase [Streptomyces sp. NPDC047022]|uniref:peptidylprolyl isomerase n=1 Tax=Streptomyces sp. NPDC047022 TaxID=3155737 RepID=UPI0033D1A516
MVSQEQRRRQLAREKFLRQQQRRAQARNRARVRSSVIASVLGLAVAGGLVLYTTGVFAGDNKEAACGTPASGSVKPLQWKTEPAMTIDKSAKYTMKLSTTCGDIDFEMKTAAAPHTVNSFDFLAGQGFFDHTKCHRLTDQGIYVLQCGDPKGTGMGGPGYTIPDENLKDKSLKGNVYPAGTVAMANIGKPHTGGSQFFLVYQDSQLPPMYTPFGTISDDGMKVLKKIAAQGAQPQDPTTGNTAPKANVVINKATVTKS